MDEPGRRPNSTRRGFDALLASQARLASHIDQRGPRDCWPWVSGKRLRRGYGAHVFYEVGCLRVTGAHRAAWALANGRLPNVGMFVCHHCDNPSCCNPAHLFLGSNRDNMRDASVKGRTRNGSTKLSWEDVLAIRALRGRIGTFQLACRYGMNRVQIQRIRDGRRWSQALRVPEWARVSHDG